MELEAKHLSPYLPYNLKLQFIVKNVVYKIGIMQTIYHDEEQTHPTKVSISGMYDNEHIWMFKPMLKSLSNLSNEELINIGLLIRDIQYHNATYQDNILAIEDAKAWLQKTMKPTLKLSQVQLIMEYLFSIHADVFNLIENNLAVNKNDEQNHKPFIENKSDIQKIYECIYDEILSVRYKNDISNTNNLNKSDDQLYKTVQLNDVLLWHSYKNRNKYSHFKVSNGIGYFSIYYGEDNYTIDWDLSKLYLYQQSEEIIQWLASLC
jgi:hypothetical protein